MDKDNFWKNISKGMMRFDYLFDSPQILKRERVFLANNETYPYVLIIDKKTNIVYSCPYEGGGIFDLMESV